MRSIVANLWQNLGTSTPGSLQVVSGFVEDLADQTRVIDGTNALTKVTPGDLTLKVLDPTGSIWTFIQTQLSLPLSAAGAVQGVLPPWLELYVGGSRMFLGTVDPASLVNMKSADDYSIEMKVIDWSMQLASTYLGSPTALPWQPNTGYLPGAMSINGGSTYLAVGPAAWVAGTLYAAGALVPAIPTTTYPNPVYQCTTGGLAASSGSGPTGTGTGIVDGAAVWQYVPVPTSASSGGPSSVLNPVIDGTVVWSYQPPTWQRPVPSAAQTGTGNSGMAFSDYVAAMYSGASPNIYFLDPAAWVNNSQLLTTDQPVFRINLPTKPWVFTSPGIVWQKPALPAMAYPAGYVIVDPSGQWWKSTGPTWSMVANNTAPSVTIPSLMLPSPQFPKNTIVADASLGLAATQYQVSADGLSWGAPGVVTNTPPATIYKVQSNTDQQVMYRYTFPAALSGDLFKAATVYPSPWPIVNLLNVQGWSASVWPGQWSANFTLANPTAADLQYWTVMVAIGSTGTNAIVLNSVSGIVVGDSIGLVGGKTSNSWTVAGVDPVLNQVQTLESVTNLNVGDHIYWTAASQGEIVMTDPVTILQAAIKPFGLDVSKFTAPITADPLFGFLPLRPAAGNDLQPIGDIEPGPSGNIKVHTGATYLNPATGVAQSSSAWTSSLDSNGNFVWSVPTVTAGAAPNADWTCQLLAAPASLMPYEVDVTTSAYPNGINAFQRLRNRAYADVIYRQENNGLIIVNNQLIFGAYVTTINASGVTTYQYTQNGHTYNSATGDNFTPWTPAGKNVAAALAVYDYVSMRRIIFNGTAMQVNTWSGTAWNAPTNPTWPGGAVQSAVPMIGLAGSILAYAVTTVGGSGGAILTSADRLELWGLTGALTNTTTCTVPPALIGGTLVSTPYGVFLVGASAIAQVTYSGGVISLVTISMIDMVDQLFANTLVARTAGEIIIFGRLDTGGTNSTTETWMFRVQVPFKATLDASVLWSEKISEGCPSLIGAIRDPSKPGRVVGHLGGSLWQVDTVRPMCVERFTPGGMTALDCIEHVCQVFNAIATPDANGTMHIVSRSQADTPLVLTVPQVSVNQTFCWPDFASITRITSQDSKFYFDAFGQQGGVLLEVDNHPMCWSLSACAAMAESWNVWFGQPRVMSEEEWFFANANAAPPWEGLQLFTNLIVNPAAVTAQGFGTGNGVQVTWTLSSPTAISVTSLTRTDWQGGSRTNYLLWSQALDNPAWTKRGTCTITPNSLTAPDGTVTGDTVSGLGAGGTNDLYQIVTAITGQRYEPSFYLYQISTSGTLVAANPETGSGWYINLALLSPGWNRITRSHPAVTINAEFQGASSGCGLQFYVSSGTVSFGFWQGQLEMGTVAGNPIPTLASPVTVYDVSPTVLSNAARTNSIPQSRTFANSYWTTNAVNITVTANATTAPDGTTTACKLLPNTSSGAHDIAVSSAISPAVTGTLSVYAKAAGYNFLLLYDAVGATGAIFNLTTGAATNASGVTMNSRPVATSMGNGWWRLSIAVAACSDPRFYVAQSASVFSFAGDGVSAVYLWGAQMEMSTTPTSYIPTTTVPVSVTDWTQSGSSVTLAQVPGFGVPLAWNGTGGTPVRLMSMSHNYVTGSTNVKTVGA